MPTVARLRTVIAWRTVLIKVIVPILFGFYGFFLSIQQTQIYNIDSGDFTFAYRAAVYLLKGSNPYNAIVPEGEYPFDAYLYYPLPAVLFAVPFSYLHLGLAGAVFFGLSSGFLAYTLMDKGKFRLPLFLSAPFVVSASVAQWGPLLIALALYPRLSGLGILLKPSQGIVAFLYQPTKRGLILASIVAAISLVLLPTWPMDLLDNILYNNQGRFFSAVSGFPGLLLLLAIIKWRNPEGRVVLASAIIPRNPYWYDSLLLWLIPITLRQSIALSLLSWAAHLIWQASASFLVQGSLHAAWIIQITLLYLPALILVLSQPSPIPSGPQPTRQ